MECVAAASVASAHLKFDCTASLISGLLLCSGTTRAVLQKGQAQHPGSEAAAFASLQQCGLARDMCIMDVLSLCTNHGYICIVAEQGVSVFSPRAA